MAVACEGNELPVCDGGLTPALPFQYKKQSRGGIVAEIGYCVKCKEKKKLWMDSDHPKHEEMLDWVGGKFDSEDFDVDTVNGQLH